MNAVELLRTAANTIEQRAKDRDVEQERAMSKTVESFNKQWGTQLTEQQGWSFMQHLKTSRANQGDYREDDYIDLIAYKALELECVSKNKSVCSIPDGIESIKSLNFFIKNKNIYCYSNVLGSAVKVIEAINSSNTFYIKMMNIFTQRTFECEFSKVEEFNNSFALLNTNLEEKAIKLANQYKQYLDNLL